MQFRHGELSSLLHLMAVAVSALPRKEAYEELTFVMLRVLNPPAGVLMWSNASERNCMQQLEHRGWNPGRQGGAFWKQQRGQKAHFPLLQHPPLLLFLLDAAFCLLTSFPSSSCVRSLPVTFCLSCCDCCTLRRLKMGGGGKEKEG